MSAKTNIKEGRRLRDDGMARAKSAAGGAWAAAALDAICAVAILQDEVFVDDVYQMFTQAPDSDPRAWGPVWSRALKTGVIERTGTWRPTAQAKKHARPYPVYKSLIRKGLE